jgi:O-antigen/teichoic acid export membrane protein
LLLTSVASVGNLCLGWRLIPFFYGPAYRPAVAPFFVLMPGILAMAVYKVLTRNYTSRNRQQVSVLVAGMALVLNVILNLYMIPRFGVLGAAFASLLSYTVSAIVLLLVFKNETGIPLPHILFIRRTDLIRYGEAWARFRIWLARRQRPEGSAGLREMGPGGIQPASASPVEKKS